MRLSLLLITFLSTGLATHAQIDPEQLQHLAIDHRLFYKRDTLYSFYYLPSGRTVKANLTKTYYWGRQDTILCTSGGFSGRLLDGEYKVFYPDKNLKESGQFSKGLKTGIWKTWYTGGRLASITHWKSGQRHGDWITYDESGKQSKSGHYKADKLMEAPVKDSTRRHSKKDSLP